MKTKILILAILASLFMVACNDDDDVVVQKALVNVEYPKGLEGKNPYLKTATFILKNINTGEKITREVLSFPVKFSDVEDGVYNIKVEGELEYNAESGRKTVPVRAKKENVSIVGGDFDAKIQLFLVQSSDGFVISEIYFTGSLNSKKRSYKQDKFFEIYNNSDKTLYADGLCIGESSLRTATVRDKYAPDVRNSEFPLGVVYRIPGNGKEYPIEPGKTLVLADVAQNHKKEKENYLDLSKANFEWYDKHKLDVDTPEVPNMEKLVSYSKTIWTPHDKGYSAYVIFKLSDAEAKEFAKTNAYAYTYERMGKEGVEVKTVNHWKIANDKIIDAVQCSAPSKYKWMVISSGLDFSWTHSGDANAERYGHSVKRKISKMEGNRIVLQDTNDSASDFIPTAPNPSPGTVADHK